MTSRRSICGSYIAVLVLFGVLVVFSLWWETTAIATLIAAVAKQDLAGHAGPERGHWVAEPDPRCGGCMPEVACLCFLLLPWLAAESRMYCVVTWERRPCVYIVAAFLFMLFVFFDLVFMVMID